MADLINYEGKRVLIVGGATGMGAAAAQKAAELGAHTIVMDIAEVSYEHGQYINVNLVEQASVDAAVEAVDGPVHVVLACAGVADGSRNLMLINFTSQRHLVEGLIRSGKLGRGGSVCFISSAAGMGWLNNLEQVKDFLDTPDWDTAAAWIDEHEGTDTYTFSKQAVNAYVAVQAFPLLQKGIRANAIMPGPTDTPLARANADLWLGFGSGYREAADVPTLVPEQMGNTMLFLGSDAASGISGISLLVDQGHTSASLVDVWDDPFVKVMAGIMEFDPAMFGMDE